VDVESDGSGSLVAPGPEFERAACPAEGGKTHDWGLVVGKTAAESKGTGSMALMLALEVDSECSPGWLLRKKAGWYRIDENDADALSRSFGFIFSGCHPTNHSRQFVPESLAF